MVGDIVARDDDYTSRVRGIPEGRVSAPLISRVR
jgi:hypothetical protein